MDEYQARALVHSLVGRFLRQDGAYRLPEGIVSGDEVNALRSLAGMTTINLGEVGPPAVSLDRTAFDAEGPPERDLRLCIDFGTALSKAWASLGEENKAVPLLLGRSVGVGDTLTVPSSIFISQSGRIFLGAAAETQHRQEIDSGRQRFDNLKRMLSEAEVGQELDDVPLPKEIDPTQCGLSKSDLLVLYLAWLTDHALEALKSHVANGDPAGGGFDVGSLRYVRRRFAIPCFEHAQDENVGGAKRAAWAREVMERALLRAQVVADTLRGKWGGVRAAEVSLVLAEARNLETAKLKHLMAQTAPVRVPIAAGASRFDEEIDASSLDGFARRDLLVIDSGAGTTDFALFQVFLDPERDKPRYSLVAPAVRMSRVAGNAVDAILRPIILEACGIDPKSGDPRTPEDFDLVKIDLSARIRNIKRELFTNGEATIELRPNVSGSLSPRTVLEDGDFERLGAELQIVRDTVLKMAFGKFLDKVNLINRTQGRSYPIYALLTGGSSSLPIIRRLAEGQIELGGARFCFMPVTESPRWIGDLSREEQELVSSSYQQCAVAIGGSARELPEELRDLIEPIIPQPPGPRIIERYQVTGVG